MGKKITWFDMISKDERKHQEEKYNNMMFPFGLDQRDKELALLKELIPNKKGEDCLYQVILLKEIFLTSDSHLSYKECLENRDIQEELYDWEKGILTSKFTNDEKDCLCKFAYKCLHIEKLEDLPNESILSWINQID